MRLIQHIIPLASVLCLGLGAVACSSDDDDMPAEGTGGTSGDGDGDGDATGGMSGDGDGDATGGAGGNGEDCSTILEAAAATPELSSLVAAVQAAGLEEALAGDDLTVFAPTNDAFAALLTALELDFSDLTADNLTPILTYHVATSVVDSTAAIAVAGSDDNTFGTLGGTITLDIVDEQLVLDKDEFAGTVVTADIAACNGIVHVIDGVIVPSIADIVTTQESFSGLNTLLGLAQSSDVIADVLNGPATAVDDQLAPGGFTLFAPTNDAVAAISPVPGAGALDDILQYHVLAGDTAVDAATALTLTNATVTMVNGDDATVNGGDSVVVSGTGESEGTVTIADIYAANGIIHQIDGVLLPTSVTAPD